MGRLKSNPSHEYFVYNKECKKSTCTVCNVDLMGNHGKNLERHIESVHPEIQKVVEEKREKQKMANTTNSTCTTQTGKQIKYTQSQLTDFKTSINIKMTKKTLINACVELVTVNGRPFSLMNNSGFKAIIDPIVNGLKNKKFKINSKNIKAEVIAEAEIVRNDIISSIKDHLVSIKVDVATRLERSFLGINVQFIKDGQIHLKTLAVLEITQAHTSEHLKKLILEVCSKYEIRKSQLYTITTDNGANMIKTVKMLPMEDYDSDSDDSIENLSEDSNDEDLLEDKIEKHLSGIESSFSINESEDCFLRGIRCAAHTLQLAIEDALRKVQSENDIISVARVVAKKLRTQALINFIRKCKLKKPILDCPTRWSSKHDMLLRLLELKDFCNDFAESYPIILLSETQWTEMQEICDCLRPAKILSKRLQAENLTLSDFYSSWLTCKMEIKGKKCAFALLLHECMESRERLILKNDVLLSAVFLDPRYKVMLSELEITRAIAHLEDLWNYVSYTSVTTNTNVSDSDSFQKSTSSTDASTDDILEKILKLKEKRVKEHYKRSSTMSIKSILQSYNSKQKRLSRKTDVIAFWESMSKTMSELYELAKIIFAVPATQVSVERLFSNLRFILSSQRVNMKDSITEDVLVVRANKMFASKKKSCDMLSVPVYVQEKTLHKNNRTQCTPCELQNCVSDKPSALRQPTANLKRIAPTDSSHAIDNKIKKYGYIVNVE